MSDDLDLGVTSARIVGATRATPAELLTLAQERAPDPEAFAGLAPYFWPSEISNGRLDAYYGRMHETTLQNFAADASAGVAVLLGHNAWAPSFGMSLTGLFIPASGSDPARTLSEAYTIPGLTTDKGITSDEMILRLRTGVQRDISVGFHVGPRPDGTRGRYACDICGGNLMDWHACPHWPGLEYDTTDPATGQSSMRLATFTVFNASLSEYSAVYDGATPGAAVLKARAANSEGLTERQVALLEQRYRTRLPAPRLVSPGVSLPEARQPTPLEETMTLAAQLRGVLGLAEDATDEQIVAATRALSTSPAEPAGEIRALFALAADVEPRAYLRTLAGELPALRQQAADGRAYRAEVEGQALAEAVRALGAEAEERYRPIISSAGLDSVRAMRDDWASIARQRLGPGGRRSTDDAPAESGLRAEGRVSVAAELPADVYQV